MVCSHDTNEDGNCGRRYCPECGAYRFPGEGERDETLRVARKRREGNLAYFERYRKTMPVVAAMKGGPRRPPSGGAA